MPKDIGATVVESHGKYTITSYLLIEFLYHAEIVKCGYEMDLYGRMVMVSIEASSVLDIPGMRHKNRNVKAPPFDGTLHC